MSLSYSRGSDEKVSATHEKDAVGHAQIEHDYAYYTTYPNRWAYIRTHYLRDAASEFLGTMLLVICGLGVNCQAVLTSSTAVASSPRGDWGSVTLGWGAGAAIGVWVSSSSGGHINPVVTLVLAVFRDFSWRKVPVYVFSQIAGGCVGALLVYANYFHAIDLFEGAGVRTQATASLFGTYPLAYMPAAAAFFSEFLGTLILILVILAATDKNNGPPPAGLVPLALFMVLVIETACLGAETSFAINPARDFGPRIALSIVGYSRSVVWGFRNQYWLWSPILATLSGGMVAGVLYDAFLFVGPESIFNRPSEAAKQARAAAKRPSIGRLDSDMV